LLSFGNLNISLSVATKNIIYVRTIWENYCELQAQNEGGSDHGLFQILSRHPADEIEENYEEIICNSPGSTVTDTK
jgi:hypothetical protein